MPNDFASFDVQSVVAINDEESAQATTCWNGTGGDLVAGALLVTSSTSTDNQRVVDYVSQKGALVTDIAIYDQPTDGPIGAWDGAAQESTEDPYYHLEHPIATYKLGGNRVEFLVPESNIGSGQGTLHPGAKLVSDTDGSFALSTNAGDFVVFQVLSAGVENGTGTFRVMSIGGQA